MNEVEENGARVGFDADGNGAYSLPPQRPTACSIAAKGSVASFAPVTDVIGVPFFATLI